MLSVFYVIHSFKCFFSEKRLMDFSVFLYDLNVVIGVAFCKPFSQL